MHYMSMNITLFHQAPQLVQVLQEQAFQHRITAAIPTDGADIEASQFTLVTKTDEVFQGILPDTGAAQFSTVGKGQWSALKRHRPEFKIDTQDAGMARVRFGDGEFISSLGTTKVKTPLGDILFHVIPVKTPFLLCIHDMDCLGIIYDNVNNRMFHPKDGAWISIVRK
ncbi:hypothetical protein K3495_g15701 [Podosphaera aphanis]|nr:hypothetical protein K3495_g15701 [Podosphaera aphanis]